MVIHMKCSKFTKSGSIVSFLDGIIVLINSYKSRKVVEAGFMNKAAAEI